MKAERFIIPWLGLLALSASAQSDSTNAGSASEYFNKASRQYVKEDKGSAMRVLDKGLRAHPGDARLLALANTLYDKKFIFRKNIINERATEEVPILFVNGVIVK